MVTSPSGSAIISIAGPVAALATAGAEKLRVKMVIVKSRVLTISINCLVQKYGLSPILPNFRGKI